MSLWLIIFLCLSAGVQAEKSQAILPEKNFDFLANYCLNCHDDEKQEGKINLEDLDFNIQTLQQAEIWQKVLNAINSGDMPPEDKKQPKNVEKADFLESLSNTMVTARKVLSDSGGKITMRRLNRREYNNTLRELLDVQVDANNLPADGAGHFDTEGASQFISSDQIEQYLKAGRIAIKEAFERHANRNKEPFVYRLEIEDQFNPQLDKALANFEKNHAKFQEYFKQVKASSEAPENKKIMEEIIKRNPRVAKTPWRYLPNEAKHLKGAPRSKDFGLKDEAAAIFGEVIYTEDYKYHRQSRDLPLSDTGSYLMIVKGINRIDIKPPRGMPVGKYKLRVRGGAMADAPGFRKFIEVGHPQKRIPVKRFFEGLPFAYMQMTGTPEQAEIQETTIEIFSHSKKEIAIQERQSANWEDLRRKVYFRDRHRTGIGPVPSLWLDWIELEGPLKQAPSPFDKILIKHQDKPNRAREIIKDFGLLVFRGKMYEDNLKELLAHYEYRRSQGDSFEDALVQALSIILASPSFLYLDEPNDKQGPRQLTDRELVIRLAYFLWSAPPDQTLLDLAQSKKLMNPERLSLEVDRMLADPRAKNFVDGFTHQWLDMERLDFFQFDVLHHREFDDNAKKAAREEVYQTILHLIKNNGRLCDLLSSDYLVVDGLMANHYGIDGVYGQEFRKVKLPEGSPRGGLLGMAAINAMGSNGLETSPVERGAWVLRHLINEPPPPAPANVPQISRLEGKVLTTRQRLTAHQEEPQCASCHRKIDPIGFGLENFDATGKWRTKDKYKNKKWTIDSSGKFHKGPAFKDYFEMKKLIADRGDDFARGFIESLIAYSLGRSYAFTDDTMAEDLLAVAKKEDYRINSIIHALVQGREFQQK
ncbi:hypothetical protein LNTAR_07519 [Lentisphaera araneosa HTCC2155]|uniref:Cytochrome c domain-containing protein n=1 Tax=Lentisphaera araneosa HTCC2155 TaxID=313628 RepID=A6DN39_9BACT|nr:DUF1592 domain-containing protein [Lentisphaera araneosa]EDM27075.1 hypothetical protein LNTAR_07519 [Lentisphaera araneosa HTCC2155]